MDRSNVPLPYRWPDAHERLVQPVQLQLQQPLGGWPDHAVERISDKGMGIANADASAEAI